jgi:mRNA interferase RelE/StbE
LFEKKLKQILKSPELGIQLWNKNGLDLTWYNKVYFANKKYRIVYKIEQDEICIYIVSIWKRNNMEVYKRAFERK